MKTRLIEKSSEQNLSIPKGSPVMLVRYRIMQDAATGALVLQTKFKNLTDSQLSRVSFSVQYKDMRGAVQQQGFVLDEGIIKGFGTLNNKKPFVLDHKTAREFKIDILSVTTADGGVWKNTGEGQVNFLNKPIKFPKKLRTQYGQELATASGSKKANDYGTSPQSQPPYWQCACGEFNAATQQCSECGVKKDFSAQVYKKYSKKKARRTRIIIASVLAVIAAQVGLSFMIGYSSVHSGDFVISEIFGDHFADGGGIQISEYIGNDENVVVPIAIKGKKVVRISGRYGANGVFEGNTTLKSIVLPEGLEEIGEHTFKDTTNLQSVTIPSTVRRISEEAFINSGIRSLVFAQGTTQTQLEIWHSAFAHCVNLSSIEFASRPTTIRVEVFRDCTALNAILVPPGIEFVSSETFRGAGNVKLAFQEEFDSEKHFPFLSNNDFYFYELPVYYNVSKINTYNERVSDSQHIEFDYAVINNQITIIEYRGTVRQVEIPGHINGSEISAIGDRAFYGCDIIGIELAVSIKSIGSYAFGECRSLVGIAIPNAVEAIGEYAFWDCYNTVVYCESKSDEWGDYSLEGVKQVYEYVNGFFEYDGLHCALKGFYITVTNYTGSDLNIIVPEIINGYGVTAIGAYAFAKADIESIILPDSIVEIEEGAFKDCSSLTQVVLSNDLEKIDFNAFTGCNLHSIIIPQSVTYMGSLVFAKGNAALQIYCETDSPGDFWSYSWDQTEYGDTFPVTYGYTG